MRKFKRRKSKKTNYRRRLGLLKSGKTRLVIRRSLNNIRIQFIDYEVKGDKTVEYFLSKNLRKYGWEGHCGNIMAGYLSGLAAGRNAAKKNVKEVIVDIGLHVPKKNSSIFAVIKGVADSGINVPMGFSFSEDRIKGKHVEKYAESIKNTDNYNKQFSFYVKKNILPEKVSEHFEETKKKILSG